MIKTYTQRKVFLLLPILLLSIVAANAQQKKSKPSPPLPSIQEMADDMNNGQQYNVKKVLQGNDPTIKFSGRDDNPELRVQYDFDRLKDPSTGEIPEGIRDGELRYINSLESHLQDQMVIGRNIEGADGIQTAAGDPVTTFSNRGPFNVGGRTRALSIDLNDENRILAGGASGGIWLSTDQGTSWSRVSPIDKNASITDIVQDKRIGFRNIWYACTGEVSGASQSGRNGSARFLGDGVYKSTDNGTTWSLLPSTVYNTPQNNSPAEPFEASAGVDIDPVNGDLYVATYRGIFRTQDGGTSFQSVLAVANLGFFSQLEIHITNSRIFYAVIPRNAITATGPGNAGIYRSTTGNLGEWVSISPTAFPATHGRVTVATAPSNENILYVLASGTSTAPVGHDFWKYTYVSGDGTGAGGNWENRSANLPNFGGRVGSLSTQGGYDQYVRVHPLNENLVFVAGTNLYRSTDGFASGGTTAWIAGYNTLNNVSLYPNHHPDQHSFVFFESNPNKVITGHDGGLSLTNDITANNATNPVAWISLNKGYLTTQVYALSVGPGNIIMAGFQDNSTWSTVSTSANATWVDQFSGDGCATAVNKTGTLRYVSAQQGVVSRVSYTDQNDNTPNSFASIAPAPTGLFVTQFELDPSDDKRMYYIGNTTIWRANNVTTATVTSGWSNLSNTTNTQQLSAIGISTVPANTVYVGSSGGRIYRIDNANIGNPAYIDVFTGKGLPTGNVSCLAIDPTNAQRVIATFSNYNIKSIWLTENGGAVWSDISGNLEQNADGTGNGPSIRWATVVGNNNAYLIGASTGLYSTKVLNGTATVWSQVDPFVLGTTVVEQVRARADGLIAVGTHGNGLFSAQFETTNIPVLSNQSIANVSVLQNDSPVVIPIGNVFTSTAPSPLAIVVNVDGNTNAALVGTSISGTDLTLTFAPNATGTALITLKGTDINSSFATTAFEVEVNPIISAFPSVMDFPIATLPFGYKTSGTMDWTVTTGSTPSSASGTGPLGDNTTGTGFYIFTETSGFKASAVGEFSLPVMDISGLVAPNLKFFYHMFGATTGKLEVFVRNVSTNALTRVIQLTGQQQAAQGDPYKEAFVPLLPYVSIGKIQIIFRGTRGNNVSATGTDIASTGDMAIDDIVVSEGLTNDIGIASVSTKNYVAQGALESVTVEITNFGIVPQSNFNVSYTVEGGIPVIESFTGNLAVAQTTPFTFTTKFLAPARGDFKITATTQLAGDVVASNNTGSVSASSLPTASLPYAESFESSDGGWTPKGTLSSWALGVPAGNFINSASQGTKAWVTNLAGKYPNNERSFVLSPVYEINGIDQIDIYLDLRYEIELGWDGAALQASTDMGATWSNVGALNDPVNWYNSNLISAQNSTVLNFTGGNADAWSGNSAAAGYVTASHAITGLAGKSTLLLRMVFASDGADNFEGIAFDNVFIGKRQTISFNALPNRAFSDGDFTLSATGGASGQPVTFTSSNPAVATVSGNTVTLVGVGTTDITASQLGNSVHFAAPNVDQMLTVTKGIQTISFNPLATKTFGDATFAITATGGASGEALIFNSSNPAVATISGNTVTIVGAGPTTITANQAGNANYEAAVPVERTLSVNKKLQTITFGQLADKTFGDPAISLAATSNAGLTVTFESLTDKVTISGSTATLAKAGKATITARQLGNGNYESATAVERSFCIKPIKPVITGNDLFSNSPTFISSSATGNQWFRNGVAINGAVNASYQATVEGSYTVVVKADDCASEPSEAKVLIITGDVGFVYGNTEMSAFPNPVEQELTVSLASFDKGAVNVSVVDYAGKRLINTVGRGEESIRLNVSSLSAGSYVVVAEQKEKLAGLQFIKK
jgi:hypothetical protein